jgi:hypothetical protein
MVIGTGDDFKMFFRSQMGAANPKQHGSLFVQVGAPKQHEIPCFADIYDG